MKDSEKRKGILGWFASNHVAANLLMLVIIVAGLISVFSARLEVFPELSLDMRISYNPDTNMLFLDFSGMRLK